MNILPGTWISATRWPDVDAALPVGSIIRENTNGGMAWVKKQDECWYRASTDKDIFRTAFDVPVYIVRIGYPEQTL